MKSLLRRLAGPSILIVLAAAFLSPAQADDRFQRYFDSVSRCGVVGYCKTTASDILMRGPTGGTRDAFERLNRQDYCEGLPRGRTCRQHYRPRGAIPQIYVDVVPAPVYRRASTRTTPSAHVRWCSDRYRSYRAADNSWQPFKGARRVCNSPHG